MTLRLIVFHGSVRRNRNGLRVARFIESRCRQRGHDVVVVDPLEYPLPLLDRMYKEYRPAEAPELLERLTRLVRVADAYLVVTAEYNHQPPPGLTNILTAATDSNATPA